MCVPLQLRAFFPHLRLRPQKDIAFSFFLLSISSLGSPPLYSNYAFCQFAYRIIEMRLVVPAERWPFPRSVTRVTIICTIPAATDATGSCYRYRQSLFAKYTEWDVQRDNRPLFPAAVISAKFYWLSATSALGCPIYQKFRTIITNELHIKSGAKAEDFFYCRLCVTRLKTGREIS